eukprot:6183194-Pleurochrysis_carterae.AAC.1
MAKEAKGLDLQLIHTKRQYAVGNRMVTGSSSNVLLLQHRYLFQRLAILPQATPLAIVAT